MTTFEATALEMLLFWKSMMSEVKNAFTDNEMCLGGGGS